MELPQGLSAALGLGHKTGPITSLHVFDFDGTLVRTPGPVEGKARYQAETGQKWKGGWWGRKESLAPPIVPSPCPSEYVIHTVFNELEEVITHSETAVGVVVTGRIKPLRSNVLRILDDICVASKNDTVPEGRSFLMHDAVFTHPGGRMTTLEYKQALFHMLLTEEPLSKSPVSELHIWEDRKEHAEVFATDFTDALQNTTGVNTTVHYITPETP